MGASDVDVGAIEGRPATLFRDFEEVASGMFPGAPTARLEAVLPDKAEGGGGFEGDLLGDCHVRQSRSSGFVDSCVPIGHEMS